MSGLEIASGMNAVTHKTFSKDVALSQQEKHCHRANFTMPKAHFLSFLVLMTGVLIMSSLEVAAQPTLDDGASFQPTALDEVLKLIGRGFTDVKNQGSAVNQILKDLADVKNLLGSLEQSFSAVDSSSLCEYSTRILCEYLH